MQLAGAAQPLRGHRLRLQGAAAALVLGAAAVVIRARQQCILVSDIGGVVEFMETRRLIPEAVGGENGVVLLAGVLQRIDDCAAVVGCAIELASVEAPGIGQRGPQRRGTARLRVDELVVPVVFLGVCKLAQIQKIAVGVVVDAHVAKPETRDVAGQVGAAVNRRKRVAGSGLHRLHARSVVGPPVGVIGHFLGVAAGAAGTVGAGRGFAGTAGVGVADGRAANAGGNRCAQHGAGHGAGGKWVGSGCESHGSGFANADRAAGIGGGEGHRAAVDGGAVADHRAIAGSRQGTGVDLGGNQGGHGAGTGLRSDPARHDLQSAHGDAADAGAAGAGDSDRRSARCGRTRIGKAGAKSRLAGAQTAAVAPAQGGGKGIAGGGGGGADAGLQTGAAAILARDGGEEVGVDGAEVRCGGCAVRDALHTIGVIFDSLPVRAGAAGGSVAAGGNRNAGHAGVGRGIEGARAANGNWWLVIDRRVVIDAVVGGVAVQVLRACR